MEEREREREEKIGIVVTRKEKKEGKRTTV